MLLKWEAAEASDFHDLVRRAPADSFGSPPRSVLPLLDFFREPLHALTALTEIAGFELRNTTELIFEYPVPVQRGQGKASFTDLAVFSRESAFIIEAKYTEPEYNSVAEWLGRTPSDNRKELLRGWLDLLGRVSHRPISADEILDLPYQLIHRVASACYSDHEKRGMAYLIFGDTPPHYALHLEKLKLRLDASRLPAFVISCPIHKTAVCEELESRWDAGDRAMAEDIRQAILAKPLYTFGAPVVNQSSAAIETLREIR